jgi:hypothetical protein
MPETKRGSDKNKKGRADCGKEMFRGNFGGVQSPLRGEMLPNHRENALDELQPEIQGHCTDEAVRER